MRKRCFAQFVGMASEATGSSHPHQLAGFVFSNHETMVSNAAEVNMWPPMGPPLQMICITTLIVVSTILHVKIASIVEAGTFASTGHGREVVESAELVGG
eukprot:TRINITY_DN82907_c0_g1_i1.p2 TRINITY_DN82907_c0_g1~~TRINITY_DN82907_c0_g1_i1.p2  ORF type:complete len:100 (-),score=9.85 TRINITY_DN82907_c0_g1_i1:43-342(-)